MEIAPWRREGNGFTARRRQLNRLFEDFGGFGESGALGALAVTGEGELMIDVAETADAYVVKAELPGVDAKGIDISVTGNTLTSRGEKHEEKDEKGKTWHRVVAEPWCLQPLRDAAPRRQGRQDRGRVEGRRPHHHPAEEDRRQGEMTDRSAGLPDVLPGPRRRRTGLTSLGGGVECVAPGNFCTGAARLEGADSIRGPPPPRCLTRSRR
jgi:HSP20 family molecular chaperone IbpA